MSEHERAGTAYDPGAVGHELTGRETEVDALARELCGVLLLVSWEEVCDRMPEIHARYLAAAALLIARGVRLGRHAA